MTLSVKETPLEGVMCITPPTIFEDYRGSYIETYNARLYQNHGIDKLFIQDDISISRRNVLRGIHGDKKTWKLISCLYGAFYLLVVDNRKDSAQYSKWCAFTLSDVNHFQILIPPGFGNGHLVLSDSAIFHYKQTTEYERESQFTIAFDDPNYDFWWPIKDPIVSIRDRGLG